MRRSYMGSCAFRPWRTAIRPAARSVRHQPGTVSVIPPENGVRHHSGIASVMNRCTQAAETAALDELLPPAGTPAEASVGVCAEVVRVDRDLNDHHRLEPLLTIVGGSDLVAFPVREL